MIQRIEAVIKKVVGEKKFLVTASDKPEFGHYSTNVAFQIPGNTEDLAKKIFEAGKDLFEKVEAKGKFINFWLSHNALVEGVAEAVKPKLKADKKLKINLEFVSANPTGPLTMANGRGGFLGDALANVLEAVGHKVTREYYINDAGNQVRLLGESVLATLGKTESKEGHYKGEYVKSLAKELEKKIKNNDAMKAGQLAAAALLKEIQQSLKKAGINYDVWFSEQKNLRQKDEIQKVLDMLDTSGLVEKKEGAVWLKSPDISEDKDRVLVKSDGNPTYFLADTAYHYDKFIKRKFDLVIDIWGADHHGYVARLKSGVKAVGVDPGRLKILITQLVRLTENGQEVKMSKRTGTFVTMDELIEEVGSDAARFFFLMHAPETHMDFDLALAKEKSQKNPVYYAQYAYVRCGSIITKALNLKFKIKNLKLSSDWDLLKAESELQLMRELVKLPDLIWQTAQDYQVSRLARYALEVARGLNNFYEKERVIIDDKELMSARLGLVAATREVLAKVLDLLGLSKPERM